MALSAVNCSVDTGRQILQIAANGQYSSRSAASWQRYANVEIVPVRVCNDTRRQIAQILAQSRKVNGLQNSVANDPLIAASLQRAGRGPNDVFAVEASAGGLMVYVY